MNPQQPVYVLAPQQQQRPLLAWFLAVAMSLIAWNGGKLPTIPALPPFPFAAPTPPAAPPTTPPAPPIIPAPPAPPAAPVNPASAICRIQFRNSGCTAVPVGVRDSDGRGVLLTAAHCVSGVGATGVAVFKDGRALGVSVVARDATSDCAFLLTDKPVDKLPALKLAERSPPAGTKVWHAGYGVDKPTNREDGERIDVETTSGKIAFRMSVSPGDSGGPIIRTDTGEVVSCVCCTEGLAKVATMYGASTENVRALLAKVTSADDWTPAEMPLVVPSKS